MNWTINPEQTTSFLAEMVGIDSVNPSLVPGAAGEKKMADWLAAVCGSFGLQVALQHTAPGRPNVLARWAGNGQGPSLLLTGHMDVVSVEGMTIEPFSPKIENGRLYGRGAFDMKGGLAAILGGVAALKAGGFSPKGDLWLGFVTDEEYKSLGSEALVRQVQADAAILTEPTGLELCIAHKGFVWLTLTTQGQAAHGSSFESGVDAIAQMGRLLDVLARMNTAFDEHAHPLLSRPSAHASGIEGGLGWSTYPNRCVLRVEHRIHPGQTPQDVRALWQAEIRKLNAKDPTFSASVGIDFSRPGYELSQTEPIVQALHHAYESTAGRAPSYAGTSGWLDSAILGAAGIPTLIFGPGGGGAHAAVEYAHLDEVHRCAQLLAQATACFIG